MFAVIISGGKQYRVEEGDVLKVEKLKGEAGDKLDMVPLFIAGDKFLTGSEAAKFVVSAEVVDHGKHKKIYIRKYKSGIQYRKRTGHRQQFTSIKIVGIKGRPGPVFGRCGMSVSSCEHRYSEGLPHP